MRKVLAISLMFIYLALFGGLKISMHYCGDNLTTFSVYDISNEKESCCATHKGCSKHAIKKMSCCEDKSIFLYSDVNTLIDSYKAIDFVPTESVNIKIETEMVSIEKPFQFNANAPPKQQGRATYLLNSSYTFYG